MQSIDLSGSSVVILGGSGTLGSRIASLMAQRGARITLAARDRSRLEATALTIPGSVVAKFDLRRASETSVPLDVARRAFGRLDGIVNAAGVVAFGPLSQTEESVIEDVLAIDLVGPLRLYRRAIPMMDGGFILNLSGLIAGMPTAGMATYSAAKAGLAAATIALAREVRRDGIAVIDAQPPHTETGLVDRAIAGSPPSLPVGLDPDAVAERLVAGVERGERLMAVDAFG